MKPARLLAALTLMTGAIAGLALARFAAAQEPPMPQVTPQHERIAKEAGVWEGESSLWPAPDAGAVKSKGVETLTMLGKFWIVGEFSGDMMGQEFHGRSQMTYDPAKKKYIGTWIDTTAPTMFTLSGDYDEKEHALTLMMEGVDLMTGQPGKWKTVTRYIDADTKTWELYAPVEGQDGKWWKMMETKYKRKK